MMRILSEIAVTLSAFPAIALVAKATLVATAGLLSACFARRSRAAVRHALLASTFGVLLALPIVSLLVTPVPINVTVAKGESDIWPLFDYVSAPPSPTSIAAHQTADTAKSGWALPPLSITMLYGWFIGAALFMIAFMKGLLEIQSLQSREKLHPCD